MSAGRTPLDQAVTDKLEDVVLDKLHPERGMNDHEAEDNAHDGGTAKAPERIRPFTIREG